MKKAMIVAALATALGLGVACTNKQTDQASYSDTVKKALEQADLTEVRDRTTAEKRAGRSADQAVETVTAAMAARYPDKARLSGAIKAAFAETP